MKGYSLLRVLGSPGAVVDQNGEGVRLDLGGHLCLPLVDEGGCTHNQSRSSGHQTCTDTQ